MMNKWLVSVLFFLIMFFEGMIFPSIFGFREGFIKVVFLVAILLYYKIDFWSLIAGTVLFMITEFYWGLKFGALVLPLLASTGIFFLLNKFFNIKGVVLTIISGATMLVVFWWSSIFIAKIL